jgi:hypothetical protein
VGSVLLGLEMGLPRLCMCLGPRKDAVWYINGVWCLSCILRWQIGQ